MKSLSSNLRQIPLSGKDSHAKANREVVRP
nr:MAG TPA: hypothetical protein [Caudoviricetes sp.]